MRRMTPVVILLMMLTVTVPARAWKFEIGEHTNLNMDYLLQVQAPFAEDAAPNQTD